MNRLFFVGSLPHTDPGKAIQFVKRFSPHLPFLPQLPDLNSQEDMIGQVLRGFELGYWDEKASCCLELFQNEFSEFPRVKIQIAGPMAVSKTTSQSFESVASLWLTLVGGILKQLRQGNFLGEIWLQVDEPYWAGDKNLPEGHAALMRLVQGLDKRVQVGIHSCATERPILTVEEEATFRFISLDFIRKTLPSGEEKPWTRWVSQGNRDLIWGGLEFPEVQIPRWVLEREPIWISAPCGLYGQEVSRLEHFYEGLVAKSLVE